MPLLQGVPDYLPTPQLILPPAAGACNVVTTGTGASRSYQLAAFNAAGVDTPLSVPFVTGAINASTPDVYLVWNDIPGAAGYRVIVNGTLLASVTAGVNNYTDSAGATGATYVAQTVNPLALGFVANAPIDGQKPTYRAAKTGLVPATSATDIAVLSGSASKTVRVTRVELSGTATTILETPIQLFLRLTADSGGTSTGSPTAYALDQDNPAPTAVMLTYTGNPTVNDGTPRPIASQVILLNLPAPTAASESSRAVWDFGNRPAQAVVLRGIAQQLAVAVNGISIAGGLLSVAMEWSEE